MVIWITQFVAFLDQDDPHAAHEIFEDLWRALRESDHPDTLLVKGFVNGAVALELAKRGRLEACHRVWKTYLKYRGRIVDSQSDFSVAARRLEELYAKL